MSAQADKNLRAWAAGAKVRRTGTIFLLFAVAGGGRCCGYPAWRSRSLAARRSRSGLEPIAARTAPSPALPASSSDSSACPLAGKRARPRFRTLRAGPDGDIGPEHLLHGVLRDIADPAGTQLARRWRKHPARLGWRPGGTHPALLLLRAVGADPGRLRQRLASQIGAQP